MSARRELNVLLFPGDGIGKEVIPEGVRVLRALESLSQGFRLKTRSTNWGCDYYRSLRAKDPNAPPRVVPEDYLDRLRHGGYDAVLLGALGDPRVLPDHITLAPLIEMRQGLDQYVCLRPARLYPNTRSPLRLPPGETIDVAVVRENSEGEYAGLGGRFHRGFPDEIATETALHTRKGIERICRYAFDLAARRKGHVTLATKSNAMKFGMTLWDDVFAQLAREYRQKHGPRSLRTDKQHVDALAMDFVRRPHTLDVVVGDNLFCDILSDLAGAVVGSLGLAPSANINPEKKYPSMFEPVSGSAPDIEGKGIANPIGTIRACSMMLDFFDLHKEAKACDRAIEEYFETSDVRTPDLGGKAKTKDVTDEIISRLRLDDL